MTWAIVKASGSGSLRYALEIEGHPYLFVTDPAITLATDKSGRTVVAGLLYDGLSFTERALPGEGKIEASGMTFKFRSPYGTRETFGTTDIMSTIFARRGAEVGALGAPLTATATTIGLVGASTLANNTYYHIGTEAFLTGTSPAITRAQWGSTAQKHNITYIRGTNEIEIFNYPTTIWGRRVTLYAYGAGTSELATLGNPIWRGIVSRHPRLDSDGMTWVVQAHHISHALKQSLVAEQVTLRPLGYYHHHMSPIFFWINLGSTGVSEDHWIAGFHKDETALANAVNAEIATALTEAGATTTEIESLRLQLSDGRWQLICETGASAPDALFIHFYSPLLGGQRTTWADADGNPAFLQVSGVPANNATYTLVVSANEEPSVDGTPTISALPPATGLWGPGYNFLQTHDRYPPAGHVIYDYPPDRVYIDHDWTTVTGSGNEGAFSVYIDGETMLFDGTRSGLGGMFLVSDADFDAVADCYYIELATTDHASGNGVPNDNGQNDTVRLSPQFRGFLTGDTAITPVVNLNEALDPTDFPGFIENLIARAPDANDGITPYLLEGDWDTTAIIKGNPPGWVRDRSYAFVSPATIGEVLSQELLLAGQMLYTTAEGKLSFRNIPLVTQTLPTDKTVSGTKIITPADGYGAWPGYEIGPQGLVAVVKIKTGYDPITNEWVGNSFEYRNSDLIARTKMRGVGSIEIAPRSKAAGGDSFTRGDLQPVAESVLRLMGTEYVSVRVHVPFTAFDYLLGDVVSLTSPHVPNSSDGSRGLSGVKAVVMGREWNLDPARKQHGILDLWILADRDIAGYTPSAVITAQSNPFGNTWELECDVANATNVVWSSNGNGKTLEHFQDGDYIQICEFGGLGSNDVTGRISGTPDAEAGTATLNLDGVWVPGGSVWTIEFRSDNGSTAQTGQRAYAYVANNNKKRADGSQARKFI